MIGKSLVLLCVVFGIAAGSCLQIPQCESGVQYAQIVSSPVSQLIASPVSQFVASPVSQFVASPVVQMTGNAFYGGSSLGEGIVSAGPVITDGPETAPLPVVQAPSVTLPVVEGPTVALPSQPIPAPRVVSQRCVCTKTIVKPQIIQRQVTVPKVQRYLKRTVTPIVENVAFKSRPITRQCGGYGYASRNAYSRIC